MTSLLVELYILLPFISPIVKYLLPLLPVELVGEMHEGRIEYHLVIRQIEFLRKTCEFIRVVASHVACFP